jgi:hypothetical protein
MWTLRRYKEPRPYPGEPWGFDSGAYAGYCRGDPFDADAYAERCAQARRAGCPYLAVVPDLVAQPTSLDFSLGWRARLPDDWPWYLALQDGMRPADVVPHVGRFAGLFLGGTSRFKATARDWVQVARDHGQRFHYGRAGTLRKLEHAIEVGADSLDSTFPMWTRERWDAFVAAWRDGVPQLRLGLT